MKYHEFTLEINGFQFDARAYYHYSEASRGAWRDGVQIEPDEDATAEIDRIEVEVEPGYWNEMDLPEKVVESIASEIVSEQMCVR